MISKKIRLILLPCLALMLGGCVFVTCGEITAEVTCDPLAQAGRRCPGGYHCATTGLDETGAATGLCLSQSVPLCGNNIPDPGEECEDGNLGQVFRNGEVDYDDTCDEECNIIGCGNGIREGVEVCDDGGDPEGECADDCKNTVVCGDGKADLPEECDDGNEENGDGCLGSCELNTCGDDIIDPNTEECDDNNTNNNDGCVSRVCADGDPDCEPLNCRVASCGDGIVREVANDPSLIEECDDGNDINDDGCFNDCRKNICGDTIVNNDMSDPNREDCDDGNDNPNDTCNKCRDVEWEHNVISGQGPGEQKPGDIAIDSTQGMFLSPDGFLYLTRTCRVLRVPVVNKLIPDLGSFINEDGDNQDIRVNAINAVIDEDDGDSLLVTVAGRQDCGSAGDGGQATGALLNRPGDIAIDELGRIYIAEIDGHRVRRIDQNGIISTIAGTGVAGFSGNGGQAANAEIDSPLGIELYQNTLFIIGGNRIRAVDLATGIISHVAGNGLSVLNDGPPLLWGDDGDARDAWFRNLRTARVHQGRLLTLDSGRRTVDAHQGRIRSIDLDDDDLKITHFAGGLMAFTEGALMMGADPYNPSGTPALNLRFSSLNSMRVGRGDDDDSIYISDGGRIYRFVQNEDGTFEAHRIVGGSTPDPVLKIARSARIFRAGALAPTDNLGLFFADSDDVSIKALQQVYFPNAGATTDEYDSRLSRRFEFAKLSTEVGGKLSFINDQSAYLSHLGAPTGVFADSFGVYVTDNLLDRVRFAPDDGSGSITDVCGDGSNGIPVDSMIGEQSVALEEPMRSPRVVAHAESRDELYIMDADTLISVDAAGNRRTLVDGSWIENTQLIIPGTPGEDLDRDSGIEDIDVAVWPADGGQENLFFADAGASFVGRIDASGAIHLLTGIIGNPGTVSGPGNASTRRTNQPSSVTADDHGNVYYLTTDDFGPGANQIIQHIAPNGIQNNYAGNLNAVSESLQGSLGVNVVDLFIDKEGDNLYYVDENGYRVYHISNAKSASPGEPEVIAGTGNPGNPLGQIAPLQASFRPRAGTINEDGEIFIVEFNNNRVRKIANGVMTTLIGAGLPQLGPLNSAQFDGPTALAKMSEDHLIFSSERGFIHSIDIANDDADIFVGNENGFPFTNMVRPGQDAEYLGEGSGIAHDGSMFLYASDGQKGNIAKIEYAAPTDKGTWTIENLFPEGTFASPAGLFIDPLIDPTTLYVVDKGDNSLFRVVDVSGASPTFERIYGDEGGVAGVFDGMLNRPSAVTQSDNGDLFVADSGNNRVLRLTACTPAPCTGSVVIGTGDPASAGEGSPATDFAIEDPRGMIIDDYGNLVIAAASAVRLVTADMDGLVDGSGQVTTIYGAAEVRDLWPYDSTSCLSGIVERRPEHFTVMDRCQGYLIDLVHKLPDP